MNIPGLALSDKVDRIDSGKGFVTEHSIEIGQTVIIFNNIGSFTLQGGKKNILPIIFGGALTLLGLTIAVSASVGTGFIVTLIGVGFLGFGLRKPDIFLLIGTCDGRQTNIVSKDRKFLEDFSKFLRRKIDDRMLTAKIDIAAGSIESIAIGEKAVAVGARGTVYS